MQNNSSPAISWIIVLLMLVMVGGFLTLVVAIIRDFLKHRMHSIWTQATKIDREMITDLANHNLLDVDILYATNKERVQTLVNHLRQQPNPLETIRDWERYRTLSVTHDPPT